MTPLGMTHIGFSSEDLERVDDSARPYVMADEEPGVFVRRGAPLWPIRDTPGRRHQRRDLRHGNLPALLPSRRPLRRSPTPIANDAGRYADTTRPCWPVRVRGDR